MRSNLARSFVRSPVIHAGASARRFRNYEAIAREICRPAKRNAARRINDARSNNALSRTSHHLDVPSLRTSVSIMYEHRIADAPSSARVLT